MADLVVNLNDPNSFSENIFEELKTVLIKELPRFQQDLKRDVGLRVRQKALEHQTAESLLSGRLRIELGLGQSAVVGGIDATIAVGHVLDGLVNLVEVNLKVGQDGLFSAEIAYTRDNFHGLLSLPEASYVSVGKKSGPGQDNGYSRKIPWLDWLLFRGTDRIVKDYSLKDFPSGKSQWSRTGSALMVRRFLSTQAFYAGKKSLKGKAYKPAGPATGWGVPAEFAGTDTKNWLTDSVEQASAELESLVSHQLVYLEQRLS